MSFFTFVDFLAIFFTSPPPSPPSPPPPRPHPPGPPAYPEGITPPYIEENRLHPLLSIVRVRPLKVFISAVPEYEGKVGKEPASEVYPVGEVLARGEHQPFEG